MAAPPPFRVIGAPRAPVRDGFHRFLRLPWAASLGLLVLIWFLINLVFAAAYVAVGGVSNLNGWSDAFFFSVQTLGTIGYGVMAPTTFAAHVIVSLESVTGLVATALATGLLFAKFGRTTARVMFSRHAVITPHDGVPTLMIRVGNERTNQIVDTAFHVTFVRTERTAEGRTWYRMYDLPLARAKTQALARSYTLMHAITPDSPLHGYTADRLRSEEVELHIAVMGLDNVTLQPVHATHSYDHDDIRIGARHADILSEDPDGTIILDLGKFHETLPD